MENTTEKTIVQNDITPAIKEKIVEQATQEIFNQAIDLNLFDHIAQNISKRMAVELEEKSFMTTDLALTEKQKDVLKAAVGKLVMQEVLAYKNDLKVDERTEKIVKIVEKCIGKIPEKMLSGIAEEINRGAIINSTAVSADSKNEDYNKMELRYSKAAGDITIPTKGVFISTNCIDIIKQSMLVKNESKNAAISRQIKTEEAPKK